MIERSLFGQTITDVSAGHSRRSHTLFCLVFAVAYGAALASLPLYAFRDRHNYLIYAINAEAILHTYWNSGPLSFLANEPLWLVINFALSSLFSPETTMRMIIFLPAAVVAYITLRHDSRQFLWLLLFLFLPQVIKNHVIHLRQGLAVALFLAGWFSTQKMRRRFFMLSSPFIHSSLFFVLMLLACVGMARRLKLAADLRLVSFMAAGLSIGLSLAWLASLVGARQVDTYLFTAANISGIGFIFWFLMLLVMCLQKRPFLQRHAFEIGTVVFYLATYFFVEVTARIFESSLLLVLMAGLRLTGWNRFVFLSLLIAMGGLHWALQSGQPWLGFGMPAE